MQHNIFTLLLDIVVWDSHPLAIGATPKQVYIDGIEQIEKPYSNPKPTALQSVPKTPNFDREAEETLKHDGLSPLETKQTTSETVVFVNVSDIYIRGHQTVKHRFSAQQSNEAGVLVVEAGKIVCAGVKATCLAENAYHDAVVVDLVGGSVAYVRRSPWVWSFTKFLSTVQDLYHLAVHWV